MDRGYQRYSELLDAYNAAVADANKLNSKADKLNSFYKALGYKFMEAHFIKEVS
jgi:hypothetical protein